MDIERLKEDIKSVESDLEYGEYQDQGEVAVNVECLRSVINFANEAIARQSATSEEVAEAISHIQGGYGDIWQWSKKRRDIIITALQAYQPTTRKNRTVEPVAISKTETTSCEWCEGNVSKYFDTNWYDFTAKNTGVRPKANYCPNCGRKLNED